MEQELAELKKELEALRNENESLKEEKYKREEIGSQTNKEYIQRHSDEFWGKIEDSFKNDTDFVKTLIRNKTIKMDDINKNNETLLHIATRHGHYGIVQLCLNLGININHKDKWGQTAIIVAQGWGRTAIQLLLLINEMNANIGNRIKETANDINKKRGITENLINELSKYDNTTKEFLEDSLMDIMINIINKKLAFSDDLLNLCWKIVSNSKIDPLQSCLWKAVSSTIGDIIKNHNKRDWYWIKQYIIPSTIWYKNMNEKEEKENGLENEENHNSDYLYYKLLDLVKDAGQNHLNELEQKLGLDAKQNPTEWDKLIKWDIPKEYDVARQDKIPNGIEPKYSHNQLVQQTKATFDPAKFYDYNQYLSELIICAQIVDDEFQKSVQQMFNVNKVTNIGKIDDYSDIIYMRGPVKLMERARNKAENDYYNEQFPTSACILDLNRCSLIFNDIKTLLKALNLFCNKVKYFQSGTIIGIVRHKNGFKEYVKETQYSDIKLNVLIKGDKGKNNILGEVQFLLQRMKEFKAKAHNLYTIERNKEFFENSVNKILPLLLDLKGVLFMSASNGDLKQLLNLMVINNKTPEYLLDLHEFKNLNNKTTIRCILTQICMNDDEKVFVFLQSIVNDTNLLIDRLFTPNSGNKTPIEEVFIFSSQFLVKRIFQIDQVKQKYLNEDAWLYRLVIWIFRAENEQIIDWILDEFVDEYVSKQKLIQLMSYKYKETIKPPSTKYERRSIITYLIERQHLNILKKLISRIGEKVFCNIILEDNGDNVNGLEVAIIKNKLNMIKYILSFDDIKQNCLNNKETLWRIIYWMNEKYNTEIVQYLINTLKLNEKILAELQSFKCKKIDSNLYVESAVEYSEKTISKDIIQKLLRGSTK